MFVHKSYSMRNCHIFCIVMLVACQPKASQQKAETDNQQEFKAFVKDLRDQFIYLEEKEAIIDCIERTYYPFVDTVSQPYYKVLFYEQLFNELNDSHMNLNSNTGQSYRLYSPIYAVEQEGRFYVKNVFSSQLLASSIEENIVGAEIISFNEVAFGQSIDAFATSCHDKTDGQVREWLANKVLAGKRHEPRVLELQLLHGERVILDLDDLEERREGSVLTARLIGNVGYIRINNSLGDEELVATFDSTLNTMMDRKALVLDLRNTVDGGNTSIAEPIMGRFVTEETQYQVCENKNEKYSRSVLPTGTPYTKPLYVLAGRWTGSMGEGMTIGFDGMQRGIVIGTELHRLAGGMTTVQLRHSDFGFRVSFEKMRHLNGALREDFVPAEYVVQKSVREDEFLAHALRLIEME